MDLASLRWSARYTPHLCDGVGGLLLVLYLAMEYMLYSLSSISLLGRLLHREDEEYNM